MKVTDQLPEDAHKGQSGRCLCIVGSRTMPGAAILVARAAQRAGAGLVAVGCLDEALMGIVPSAAPESVLLDLTPPMSSRATEAFEAALDRTHAMLIGPGIGVELRGREWLGRLRGQKHKRPLVVDADGLGVLGAQPERLREVAGPVVITPHVGEAERLLGTPIPSDADGRARYARLLAQRSGAIVCLKGKGTVVTDGEHVSVGTTGNVGMATAGTGDVLAGILVAYLARSAALTGSLDVCAVFAVAERAVHVHGLAGDMAARDLGTRAVIASDLIHALPEAQRELDLQ